MKSWFMAGSNPKNYELGIDADMTFSEKNSGYIKAIGTQSEGFGTLMQSFHASDYRGKRMRFSAVVKSEGIEQWAGLWMRIDGQHGSCLGFDNMENRPITGTADWQKYEIVLDVPEGSASIHFGILLSGRGQAWMSNVQFEEVGTDVSVTTVEREYPDKPGNLDFAE